MLVLATAFWGLSFPIIKALHLLQLQLIPGGGTWFSAVYLVAPRFVLATSGACRLAGAGFLARVARELKQGVIIGLFATAGMLFQNDGLQFTSASTSAFLTQFYAILIRFISPCARAAARGQWCGSVALSCSRAWRFSAGLTGRTFSLGRGEWETLLSSLFFMGRFSGSRKRDSPPTAGKAHARDFAPRRSCSAGSRGDGATPVRLVARELPVWLRSPRC